MEGVPITAKTCHCLCVWFLSLVITMCEQVFPSAIAIAFLFDF